MVDVATLQVDPSIATEVAAAYVDRSPVPLGFLRASYAQLTIESDGLFAALTHPRHPDSVRVRFSSREGLYASAAELIASVREERLLEVTVAATDRDRRHPIFDDRAGGAFDRFRAVHDILGHACLGAGFDRHGEYATWRYQELFHSPLARMALATELHAKHSVRWTTGEAPDHRAVPIDLQLLERSRQQGDASTRERQGAAYGRGWSYWPGIGGGDPKLGRSRGARPRRGVASVRPDARRRPAGAGGGR